MAAPRSLLQKMKDRESDVMAAVDAQTAGSPPPKPPARSAPSAPSPVSGPSAKGAYNAKRNAAKKRK